MTKLRASVLGDVVSYRLQTSSSPDVSLSPLQKLYLMMSWNLDSELCLKIQSKRGM